MSADSPSLSKSKSRTSPSLVAVLPQQVTDPTILDSVAGFISEVVPTSYNVPSDLKDQIQWAHFEQLESDESSFSAFYDCEKSIHPPLILVLGYTTGIQVWAIPENGEAVEILSWRHGSVQVLRLLPAPHVVDKSMQDLFESKRPLIAVCDTANPMPAYCALSFLSLKTGEQIKQIKFKNPILDVLANKRSVVVTFSEKIAIFDSFTLEDRLTVTTCYISPGLYPNPVALGTRWLAYAEKKLVPMRRSSGGIEGEGVQSYTATVLNAAKSLGRGLRELGETVASSLTSNSPYKPGGGSPQAGGHTDVPQKGVVTVLDIESPSIDTAEKTIRTEAVISHFAAHSEAVVCLKFDPSGMLLLTADKRGHDFHLFRIHPHPGGPALAAVHHLYTLHRGDTTAKVQHMCFSPDSRWVAVSTLRGTTHVFPVTPYGGNVGVRTHATPHVVNRMSRFQRSAGLTAEGRSNSPVSLFEAPVNSNFPYHNPRLPPYPHPTVVHPLAQIRQPVFMQNIGSTPPRTHGGRQRLSSGSEENLQVALRVSCCFAPARAWLDPASQSRESISNKPQVKSVESVFIINCHGILVQYDLDPRHASSVPKEKVCDDTPVELTVCAKAQWVLQRQVNTGDVQLPLSKEYLALVMWQNRQEGRRNKTDHKDDRWLSQVEIMTHAGPHRRLWMGPQFTFKTYTTNEGSPLSVHETKSLDVGRSKPVNMPTTTTYPILIESGSVSSCDQSPKLQDTYQHTVVEPGGAGEVQLKEDLAEAMLESPGVREAGGRCVIVSVKPHVAKVVNPLGTVVTVHSDDDSAPEVSEDTVIHENCDEALFRPVVAPQALIYTESRGKQLRRSKPLITDDICAKNLKSVTELTYNKIPTKQKASEKVKRPPPKVTNKSEVKIDLVVSKPVEQVSRVTPSYISDFSDAYVDANDKFQSFCKLSDSKTIVTLPVSEKPSSSPEASVFQLDVFDFPKPDLELEKIKTDVHRLARPSESCTRIADLEDTPSKNILNERQHVENFSSSEENVIEEKTISKKLRKPKPKLGVRIANINKENGETFSEKSAPVAIPAKKSWSSIASSKTKEEEADIAFELPKKMSFSDAMKNNLIEIDDVECKKDESQSEKIYDFQLKVLSEDLNVLKVDKSSDDEKVSSSQTETTESDDSGKIPEVAMETEDDAWQPMTQNSNNSSSQNTKSARKKSKKKRK